MYWVILCIHTHVYKHTKRKSMRSVLSFSLFYREIKWLTLDHWVGRCQNQSSNLSSLGPMFLFLGHKNSTVLGVFIKYNLLSLKWANKCKVFSSMVVNDFLLLTLYKDSALLVVFGCLAKGDTLASSPQHYWYIILIQYYVSVMCIICWFHATMYCNGIIIIMLVNISIMSHNYIFSFGGNI